MKLLTRLRIKILLALVAACVLCSTAALYLSPVILCVETRVNSADAIVVLGGELTHRPDYAVELFQRGIAPHVVISGNGDCDEARIVLVGKGTPEDSVQMECESRNTKENAEFSIPLLRQAGAKRVVIVTSWFHSRRALNCFRHFAPDMEFVSMPTVVDRPVSDWPNRYEREWVLTEYLKLAYYWVRYGVSPF